jgi:hypothetical protein
MSATVRGTFGVLNTTDFEVVIRALKQAAALSRLYSPADLDLSRQMQSDAAALRDLLARTIAASHPERPADIADANYAACRGFLSHFQNIYTLNYDLLLYWALMQSEIEPGLAFDDGFREPEEGPADYVTWDVQKTDQQNTFYLHGGLHIFDAQAEVQKFTWCNTGIALIDQIRDALATDRFPLFVAEGSHQSKLERIQHSGFLNRAYRSFAAIKGALFVYGFSFGDSDEHVTRVIGGGRLSHLYISLHGDPNADGNRRILDRAAQIEAIRAGRRPLEIQYFDADSAHVWG